MKFKEITDIRFTVIYCRPAFSTRRPADWEDVWRARFRDFTIGYEIFNVLKIPSSDKAAKPAPEVLKGYPSFPNYLGFFLIVISNN